MCEREREYECTHECLSEHVCWCMSTFVNTMIMCSCLDDESFYFLCRGVLVVRLWYGITSSSSYFAFSSGTSTFRGKQIINNNSAERTNNTAHTHMCGYEPCQCACVRVCLLVRVMNFVKTGMNGCETFFFFFERYGEEDDVHCHIWRTFFALITFYQF